jgi:hypothetical protein
MPSNGIAYWFPHQGTTVQSTLMLDYDGQTFPTS